MTSQRPRNALRRVSNDGYILGYEVTEYLTRLSISILRDQRDLYQKPAYYIRLGVIAGDARISVWHRGSHAEKDERLVLGCG